MWVVGLRDAGRGLERLCGHRNWVARSNFIWLGFSFGAGRDLGNSLCGHGYEDGGSRWIWFGVVVGAERDPAAIMRPGARVRRE